MPQFVLAVMWFFFIASCSISAVGLIMYVGTNLYYFSCCCLFFKSRTDRLVYETLTLREIEYLEYIKSRDLIQYGDILQQLKRNRRKEEFSAGNDLIHELDKFIFSLGDV